MNTIKFDKKQVKMVAHRGVSGLEPENTISAFIAAGNRSYFGIETDVHVTADNRFLIMHDSNFLRTAGVDMVIEEHTYEELRAIPLRDKQGNYRSDLRAPSLQEYINICKYYDKVAVLEIKNHMQPEQIAAMVRCIEAMEYLEQTIFISFDWDNLVSVRAVKPQQNVQFLTSHWDEALPQRLMDAGFDLDIHWKAVDAKKTALLREKGIVVNVWTCDQPEDGQALAEMGVDYITSNILE